MKKQPVPNCGHQCVIRSWRKGRMITSHRARKFRTQMCKAWACRSCQAGSIGYPMLLRQLVTFLMLRRTRSDSLALRTWVEKLALYCCAMLRYGQVTDIQPSQAAPCSHQEMCQVLHCCSCVCRHVWHASRAQTSTDRPVLAALGDMF